MSQSAQQYEVREVDALPVLDQDAMGAIPEFDDEHRHVLAFYANTPWQSSKKETVAGAVLMACRALGDWRAVSVRDFFPFLQAYPVFNVFPQPVVNAMWEMAADGDVEIVSHKGMQYIVPTKIMVDNLYSGQSRYITTQRPPRYPGDPQ